MRAFELRHLLVIVATAMLLGAAGESLAQPTTVPPGLNPGDQYRLAFVTSTTRDATSFNIADYNAFVTAVAATVPELVALGTTWTAIGSTASSAESARDNTATYYHHPLHPIFSLSGEFINGYSVAHPVSIWNSGAPLDVAIDVDENGGGPSGIHPCREGPCDVWTGTPYYGAAGVYPLGDDLGLGRVTRGTTAAPLSDTTWVDNGYSSSATELHHLYALSGILTVPGFPCAPGAPAVPGGALLAIALAVFAAGGWGVRRVYA